MAGLARCPSFNAVSLGRASSIPSPRKSGNLAAAGRRASLDCSAAMQPEPQQPGPRGWGEWDLDATAMPWAASPGPPSHPQQREAEEADDRRSLLFYPASQQLDRTYLQPATPCERGAPAAPRDGTCHVILFGVGEELTEGIYTLRTQEPADGDYANVDTVVAFEAAVDAERFATMLEASLGHEPTVFPIAWADITEWCNENNTRCRLEPAGSVVIPPSSNLGVTDWERLLSLRRNQYQVLDAEPELGDAPQSSGFFIDGPEWVCQEESAAATLDLNNIVDSKLADPTSRAAARQGLERAFNL